MEVAAELQDMVESDLVKVYPDLVKAVRIAVIELQDHVLSTYDRRISEYTRQIFTRQAKSTLESIPCGSSFLSFPKKRYIVVFSLQRP